MYFIVLGMGYILIDIEDYSKLITWENYLLVYWACGLQYQILKYRISNWCSWWLL